MTTRIVLIIVVMMTLSGCAFTQGGFEQTHPLMKTALEGTLESAPRVEVTNLLGNYVVTWNGELDEDYRWEVTLLTYSDDYGNVVQSGRWLVTSNFFVITKLAPSRSIYVSVSKVLPLRTDQGVVVQMLSNNGDVFQYR